VPRITVNYPPMVLDYVSATLRDPATSEHAALSQAWDVVARLQDPSHFAGAIQEQMQQVGNNAPVQVVAAWLATDQDSASKWLLNQVAEGKSQYLTALYAQPALGRAVLPEAQLDWGSREQTDPVLSLLRVWEPPVATDKAVLDKLLASDEPKVRLRTIGYLLAIDAADDKQLAELKEALRSDRIAVLSGAAEACRVAQRAELADALVNAAALVPLGSGSAASPSQPESTGLYAAYALTFLPGEQAQLLRSKLLDAADVRIRWQARLGELLHGDIKPWYDAVLKTDPGDNDMWLALQPDSVADQGLLLTFKKTAAAKDPQIRLKTAQHLNRYTAWASDPVLREVFDMLIDDEVNEVAAQAWQSAGIMRMPGLGAQAQQVLDDAAQSPQERLAAAYYQLSLAEPQPAPRSPVAAEGAP
jgi:hypothetical protein